jgi:hypothetical protein
MYNLYEYIEFTMKSYVIHRLFGIMLFAEKCHEICHLLLMSNNHKKF